MTPKRPEAICLIFADGLSPFGSGWKWAGSSPPSPVSDLAPIRFIATLSALCASGPSAPSDMPGVTKRLRIEVMDSTSSSGTEGPTGLKSSRSRRWIGGCARMPSLYFFHRLYEFWLTAACMAWMTWAPQAWVSPLRRAL